MSEFFKKIKLSDGSIKIVDDPNAIKKTGDNIIDGSLTVTGELSGNEINSTTNIIAGNDIEAGNNISASNDISASQDITAGNDISATQNIAAGNDLTIGHNLSVGNDTTITNDLTVGGDTSLHDTDITGNLTTTGEVSSDTLDVTNNAHVGGDLTVDGDLDLTGDIDVDNINATNNITAGGNISATGSLNGSSASITNNTSTGTLTVTNMPTTTEGIDYVLSVDSNGNIIKRDSEVLVPAGGIQGQMLAKASNTDYDTEWITPVNSYNDLTDKPSINGVELVGENKAGSYYGLQNRITATGILKKTSADATVSSAVAGTDYIAPGDSRLVKSGGTTNQVLAKTSNSDYAFDWTTINTFTIIDSSQASDTPLNIKWNDGTSDVTGTLTSQQVLANYGPKVIFAIPTSITGTQAEGQYERSLNGGRILYVFDSNTNTFVKITATEFDVEHTHTITPTITTVSASASGVAVTNSADTFVKSYPGTFSRFEQTSVRGVSGTDTASLVSHTNATVYADIAEDSNKLSNGVLKFNINMTTTSNGNTGVSVVNSVTETNKTLAVSSSTDTTVATGSLLANATGDQVMTGLGNATTANAIISSSVTSQPTVVLNNQPSIDVVTNVTGTNNADF